MPLNPATCRTLTDEEFNNLKRLDPSIWRSPSKTCKTCSKKGPIKILDRSTFQIREVECNCKEQWKLHLWFLNAGIGTRYQRLAWDDADGVSPSVKSSVLGWLNDSEHYLSLGRGLTLWSPNRGTGKTMLAALCGKYLMAEGHDVFMSIFSDLIDRAQDGWRDKEARNWFEARIKNAPVLIMDDIGRENQARAELVESMLDPIIRWRVANERPTIITTNFDQSKMQGRYGANILSLLNEANEKIEVSGTDYRSENVEERARNEAKLGIRRPIVVF